MDEIKFIDILNDLEKSSDKDEIKSLSDSLCSSLVLNEDNEKFIVSYIKLLLNPIFDTEIMKVSRVDDKKYISSDVNFYTDSDKKRKVTIFVAFLQDHEKIIKNFDEIFLKKIVFVVKQANLNLLINDINVNSLKWRNE